jgi:hypothetical protein
MLSGDGIFSFSQMERAAYQLDLGACSRKDMKPAAGVPLDAVGTATETVVNTSAVDVLRRLPGVTEGNYRDLMQAAGAFMPAQIASYMPLYI